MSSSGQIGSQEIEGFGIFDEEPVIPESSGIKHPVDADAQILEPKDNRSETLRVQVAILDKLMNLVGEQVLVRNQLIQYAKSYEAHVELAKLSQRLNILTAELQNVVMKTRMQPIGSIFSRFTRVVRDLGRELSKSLEFNALGSETELDKTIIEAIRDPLTHIIRNSIDHGIEPVEERRAKGKKETGKISVKAHHENGQVVIEIADDGRGLESKLILEKAIARGFVKSEAQQYMNDREIQNLIFLPGFSTMDRVSPVSGRGVGMDVVRQNVERVGGVIDLQSVAGFGMTIRLKIPLTLAIVPALIVCSAGQRFAIPQSKLMELVLIDESNNGGERLEILQGCLVLRLRGEVLPVLVLSEELNRSKPRLDESIGDYLRGIVNIAILNADGQLFGLIVDSVEDTTDIVVKSLPYFLKDLGYFSGATIMGDGSVALAIDVSGVASGANLHYGGKDLVSNLDANHRLSSQDSSKGDGSDFLLVDLGTDTRFAIPLFLVARIEEFSVAHLDFSGDQRVVKYRDMLLPIFSLHEFLNLSSENSLSERDQVAVVVVDHGGRLYGIEVYEFCDVVSIASEVDHSIKDRAGIFGTLILGDEVLVVVDVLEMIDLLKTSLNCSDALPRQSADSPIREEDKNSLHSDIPEMRKDLIGA